MTDDGSAARPRATSAGKGPRARRVLGLSTFGLAAWGLGVIGLGFGSTGCVLVKPQERKNLSKPEMTPTTESLEDMFHAHIESARRAGINGHGGGGGGCGCG